MELSFTDPDQWYEEYESASLKRRYDILMETLDQPLSRNFIEDVDLGMCLVSMMDELTSNNLITQTLAFIDRFQTKQPDFYEEEFQYFDNFLVVYYLYRDEKEKVAQALSRFMEDPASGIDQMIPLLDYLRFYECMDALMELCRKTYIPVQRSPEIIGSAEDDLGVVVFIDMVDKAYRIIRRGEIFDWTAFVRRAGKYGYTGGQEMAEEIKDYLTQEMEGGEAFIASFKRNRKETLNALVWAFLRYMLDQKNIGFVCSEHIMNGVLKFLGQRELRSQKSVSPNTYFGFSKNELDQYLGRLIGGFMSTQQAKAMGILWGIVYLYDFLSSKAAISDSIHRHVVKSVNSLKNDSIKVFRRTLWKYDFVHRWTPPDSVPNDRFAAESELFSKTIEMEVPLGDEPAKGPMDFLRQFMDMELPPALMTPGDSSSGPAAGKEKRSGKSSAKKRRKKKKKRKR
jgi:hypothetical protein